MERFRKTVASTSHLEVSVDEVAVALDADTHTLLDVREQDEWDEAHIQGAVLIPGSQLYQRIGEISAEKPVYIMCHSGHRSLYAIDNLEKAGHHNAKSMAGGIVAWAQSGKPIAR